MLNGIESFDTDPAENEPIAYWQLELIEKMIVSTPYNGINIEIEKLTFNEANELIERLKNSQMNPIKAGYGYNMGDISYIIKKILKNG